MAKLSWDVIGERIYEAGVDRGVFYPSVGPGLAWNGLISVTETDEGTRQSVIFVDGRKTRNELLLGSFSATIQAFTYPDEFEEYDGIDDIWTQQQRKPFGFSYRTMINQSDYKLHLVFNALASPSDAMFSTIDDSVNLTPFTWTITTKPLKIPFANPTAHLIIDTTVAYPWVVEAVENILYGTETEEPRFPSLDEIMEIFEVNSILRIINHGDGTWTAIGPDDVVSYLNPTTFQIDWPSVVYLDSETYRVSSL